MSTIIIIVLGVIMLFAAIFTVFHKNLLAAIISAGVVSLLASVLYLTLAAPDVAMTEASIGSALTTVIFLFALNRIRKEKNND